MQFRSHQITIWDENYPKLETIIGDINTNNAVVYELDGKVIAYLAMYPMMEDPDEEYYQIHKNYCYIKRVMVTPKYRRHGYAQEILKYVESLGFNSTRLLTRNTNTYSVNLYKKLGYKVVKYEARKDQLMETCEKVLKNE